MNTEGLFCDDEGFCVCGNDCLSPQASIVDTVHVEPVNDLVEHEDEGCVCGPGVEAVFRGDGSNGWLITHHSLDGREQLEEQK